MQERLNVLIVAKTETLYASLRKVISGRVSQTFYASTMTLAKQKLSAGNVDIVIINTPLPDEFGVESALQIAQHFQTGIMLLVGTDEYERVRYKVESLGIFLLSRPIKVQALDQSLSLMIAMQHKLHVLAEENSRLRRRMDELGLVSRAKCLLIEKKGMSEQEAHYYLEREAMNKGYSKRDIAEDIISRLGI